MSYAALVASGLSYLHDSRLGALFQSLPSDVRCALLGSLGLASVGTLSTYVYFFLNYWSLSRLPSYNEKKAIEQRQGGHTQKLSHTVRHEQRTEGKNRQPGWRCCAPREITQKVQPRNNQHVGMGSSDENGVLLVHLQRF